jgi:glyoxylase-like metal-dependent hydrolase (beta-lactamase superfamily II)
MEHGYRQASGPWVIETVVTGGEWQENCYIVQCLATGEQAVIDPGDDAERLIGLVDRTQGPLRQILLTHGHHDHVSGAEVLCRRYGLRCLLHPSDARILRQAPNMALRFGGKRMDPVQSYSFLDKSGVIPFAGREIAVIPTPGHTPGGVCFDFGSCAFPGDTILYRRAGRADLPGGDEALLAASIEGIMERLGDDTVLFGGHGRPWTVGEAKAWWCSQRDVALGSH